MNGDQPGHQQQPQQLNDDLLLQELRKVVTVTAVLRSWSAAVESGCTPPPKSSLSTEPSQPLRQLVFNNVSRLRSSFTLYFVYSSILAGGNHVSRSFVKQWNSYISSRKAIFGTFFMVRHEGRDAKESLSVTGKGRFYRMTRKGITLLQIKLASSPK